MIMNGILEREAAVLVESSVISSFVLATKSDHAYNRMAINNAASGEVEQSTINVSTATRRRDFRT